MVCTCVLVYFFFVKNPSTWSWLTTRVFTMGCYRGVNSWPNMGSRVECTPLCGLPERPVSPTGWQYYRENTPRPASDSVASEDEVEVGVASGATTPSLTSNVELVSHGRSMMKLARSSARPSRCLTPWHPGSSSMSSCTRYLRTMRK
jgi:hypothetical protein